MAEYNTVPLGQAGTGAAFTLGENRALPLFQQQIALNNQKRDLEAQKLAKSYRDNMLAASDGKLFAREMGNLEQNHIKQGMDYRAQGFDIYNPDPNNPQQMAASQQYLADRRMIENLRAYRKGIEDDFTKGAELLSKGVEGEYDPQTVAARNRIVSEGSLMDLYNKGERLPALQKRFSLGDNLKGLKAPTIQRESVENGLIRTEEFVDEPKARNLVISAMMNKPEGQAQLAKVTKGIPIQELNALPNTLSEIENRVNEDYAGTPDGLKYLASKGILVDTPQYDKFMKSQAKTLYEAKKELNTLVDRGVAQISQGIKTIDKSKPTITEYQKAQLANKEQDQALAARRENRMASESSGSSSSGDSQSLFIPYGKEKKDVVEVKEYVPISVSKKNFAGSEYIDLKTGKIGGKLSSSNDYEIVGVGNIPIINSGNQKGAISQPSFAAKNPNAITLTPMIHVQQIGTGGLPNKDYFIPYNRLPENLKNTKSIKEALSKFKPATGAKTITKPNTTVKPKSDPLGLF